jgi:hypothetical protein
MLPQAKQCAVLRCGWGAVHPVHYSRSSHLTAQQGSRTMPACLPVDSFVSCDHAAVIKGDAASAWGCMMRDLQVSACQQPRSCTCELLLNIAGPLHAPSSLKTTQACHGPLQLHYTDHHQLARPLPSLVSPHTHTSRVNTPSLVTIPQSQWHRTPHPRAPQAQPSGAAQP